jgi:hypothetical protein
MVTSSDLGVAQGIHEAANAIDVIHLLHRLGRKRNQSGTRMSTTAQGQHVSKRAYKLSTKRLTSGQLAAQGKKASAVA